MTQNVGVHPPKLMLGLLTVGAVLHVIPQMGRVVVRSVPVGLTLLVAGGFLMAWCIRLFDRAGTTHTHTGDLVTLIGTGPYRVSRNPMYLSMVLVMLGIGLCAGSLGLLVAPAVFVVTIGSRVIPVEERALAARFGAQWARYRNRVRRWL